MGSSHKGQVIMGNNHKGQGYNGQQLKIPRLQWAAVTKVKVVMCSSLKYQGYSG